MNLFVNWSLYRSDINLLLIPDTIERLNFLIFSRMMLFVYFYMRQDGRLGVLVECQGKMFFFPLHYLKKSFASSFGCEHVKFLKAKSGYATTFAVFVLIYSVFPY